MRRAILVSIFIAAFCLASHAQESTTSGTGWTVDFTPYLWMAGQSGDVTVRGIIVRDVDISFSDAVKDLDMGLAGHLEATRGNWTLLFDAQYMNLSESPEVLIIRLKNTIAEIGGGYHLNPHFEVLGGVRIIKYRLELTPRNDRTYDQSKTWGDPFVGGQVSGKLGEKFTVSARGDIGGFGLGSDFAWNVNLAGSYRFARWGSFYIAQRWLDVDYKSEEDGLKINLLTAGPVLGLTFHF